MNKKRMILSVFFFILLIACTFYIIFKDTSIEQIVNNLKGVRWYFTVIGISLIFIYFLLQAIYMKVVLKALNAKVSIGKCLYYSVVEFFFSGITPSSMGGQPLQLYYMTKDKIPMRKSLVTLIINTIYFKIFLLVFGIIILMFKNDLVFGHGTYICVLFFLGMIVDLIVVIINIMFLYHQSVIKNCTKIYYKIINKVKRKNDDINVKISESASKYGEETKILKHKKKELLFGLLIVFLQRIALFSIGYLIYYSFGFREFSYFDLMLIQICATISIEGLPLPGGTGANEFITRELYEKMFKAMAVSGMIATRFFSFYLPIVVLCIAVILVSKVFYDTN